MWRIQFVWGLLTLIPGARVDVRLGLNLQQWGGGTMPILLLFALCIPANDSGAT